MPDGVFLSLDGLDGTGKSTQCRLLVDRLRAAGRAVTACADPGGTELGTKLRELLLFGRQHQMGLRTEALLFMASRAELVDQVIRPGLLRGEVVVSDRFLLSTVVYQGHAGGLNPDLLWRVGKLSTGGLAPDLTLVFDVPLEVARARGKHEADRLESRGDEYNERVRIGFLTEARRHPEQYRVIDATRSAEVVHEEVWRVVSEFLRGR
jgi:dTMP kinase